MLTEPSVLAVSAQLSAGFLTILRKQAETLAWSSELPAKFGIMLHRRNLLKFWKMMKMFRYFVRIH